MTKLFTVLSVNYNHVNCTLVKLESELSQSDKVAVPEYSPKIGNLLHVNRRI